MSTVSAPEPSPRAARPRATRQKAAVDRALDRIPDFVSAQELHARLQDQGERVSLATVYRTLQQQLDDGLVDMLRRDDGESVYRRCSEHHHHHLVCRSCGVIADIDCAVGEAPCLTPSDDNNALEGFVLDEAEVIYWGLCPDCSTAVS